MNAVVRMYMVVVVVYSRQTESSNSNSPLNDSCPKSIFHPTRLSYIFMSQQNVIIKHKDVLLLFVIKLLSNINPTITYTRTTRHRCQDFSSSTFVCVCVRLPMGAVIFKLSRKTFLIEMNYVLPFSYTWRSNNFPFILFFLLLLLAERTQSHMRNEKHREKKAK